MTQPLQYASFWERLTAFMLDLFIIIIPVLITIGPISAALTLDLKAVEAASNKEFEFLYQCFKSGAFFTILICAGLSFILASFATSKWQASPGKRLANIYIGRKNGDKITLADAFGRFISLPLFIMMITIFERREDLAVMESLKSSGKTNLDTLSLERILADSGSQIIGPIVLLTIFFWFFKIFLTFDKTSIHDTLFNTRVFRGKK